MITTFEEPERKRFQEDLESRRRIAQVIGEAIEKTVIRELNRGMDERQATTALRTNLEHVLGQYQTDRYRVSAFGHESTSLVRNSQERAIGADLYFGVEIDDGERTAKGLLVQAKRLGRIRDPKLLTQCENMLRLSEESYVWVYSREAVWVLSARDVTKEIDVDFVRNNGTPIVEHIDRVLKCSEGSQAIGIPFGVDRDRALVKMMKDFHARAAVEVVIERDNDTLVWR